MYFFDASVAAVVGAETEEVPGVEVEGNVIVMALMATPKHCGEARVGVQAPMGRWDAMTVSSTTDSASRSNWRDT
jgi:hypothetical protein